jgi:Zn-dependent peptidase ImmA (M78 family)/DNA-binding XRE family transcriptional regulator
MNRIKDLRIARGLSLQQLADAIGNAVTRQALWKYEKGTDQPRPSIVVRIAEALGVKALELFTPPDFTIRGFQFRSTDGLKKKERARLTSLLVRELERRIWLHQKSGVPRKTPPPVEAFEITNAAEAEAAATSLRTLWGLQQAPIPNVIQLLESQGVYVVELKADSQFDGLCAVARDADNNVIGVAIAYRKGCTWSRQRFSLLHELGHAIGRFSGKTEQEIEKLVNRFAGAFLVPWQEIDRLVGPARRRLSLEELLIFKSYFGASVQCLVYRLFERGLLSMREYRAAWEFIERNGWRKKEPEESPAEHSQWARMTALGAYAEGILTREEAQEFIGHTKPRLLRDLAIDRRKILELPLNKRAHDLQRQAKAEPASAGESESDWDQALDDGLQ